MWCLDRRQYAKKEDEDFRLLLPICHAAHFCSFKKVIQGVFLYWGIEEETSHLIAMANSSLKWVKLSDEYARL